MAKKTLALTLAVMMVMTVLVVPASAASDTWVGRFKKFANTSIDSFQTGYTKAVQSILLGYSDQTYTLISNAGGVDGWFGDSTKTAVQLFQDNETSISSSNSDYGKVKSATWGAMADYMTADEDVRPVKFYMNDRNAITAKYYGGAYDFYYHTTAGSEGGKFASVY